MSHVPDWLRLAELSAVADCGYLCSAGLWLFFSLPSPTGSPRAV